MASALPAYRAPHKGLAGLLVLPILGKRSVPEPLAATLLPRLPERNGCSVPATLYLCLAVHLFYHHAGIISPSRWPYRHVIFKRGTGVLPGIINGGSMKPLLQTGRPHGLDSGAAR